MSSRHRDKTPRTHRLQIERNHQNMVESPRNIYTHEFEKFKNLRQHQSGDSTKSIKTSNKYKKLIQTKSTDKRNSSDRIKQLMKQNSELRQEIVDLKVHQFYQLDGKKLKELLIQVESLRDQLRKCQEKLEKMKLQNDYLKRTNTTLKSQMDKFQTQKITMKKLNVAQNNIAKGQQFIFSKQDEQLTEKLNGKNKEVTSPNMYSDFEEYQKLLESKSTTKQDRIKRQPKQRGDLPEDYLLLLQSKSKFQSLSKPQNHYNPRLSTSPRQSNQLLKYKSRRKYPRANNVQ